MPIIVTVIAVVVALAAAGLVYLFARKGSDTATGGQSTPQDAVVQMLGSVSEEDPIGIADQLDPTEAHLFADMTGDIFDQLKRLGVINKDVDKAAATGVKITTKDLTFADQPISINDHLSIVQLTGGTVTVQTGTGTFPFSKKILDAFPELAQTSEPQTETVDIAKEVAEQGHPFRIATVNRDGKWYPSLFYTAADNWAFESIGPDYHLAPIANAGGSSPEDAMNAFLDAAMSGDPKAIISVLSPDEMGVLHDYGTLMIDSDSVPSADDLAGVQLSDVTWSVSDVTGGKKVSIKNLTLTTPDGAYTIARDPAAGSVTISMPGQGSVNINQDNIDTWLDQNGAADLDPQIRDIIKREFPKVIGLGVVMVQGGDGKWYVSPLRSFSDVLVSLLSGLESADIDYFIKMATG
jgi:hypothetical protein